jgi:hypothetical protein
MAHGGNSTVAAQHLSNAVACARIRAMTLTDRLRALVRESPVLMEALRAARAVDPPDWLIAAGAIRDAVWDVLHDRAPALPRDIDVGYFDPGDLTPGRDEAVSRALRARAPQLPWDAKNQAAVHVWYPRRFGVEVPPFRNTAEAVATFPETASCVGLRLLPDDALEVVAPYGLEDLFGLVCRRNPARVSAELYERRVAEKGWAARWPDLRISSDPPSSSVNPQRR